MGSRIIIDFDGLVSASESVKVQIERSEFGNLLGKVQFFKAGKKVEKLEVEYVFDYSPAMEELPATLEADFNFFRYEQDAIQLKVFRQLFEHGIDFRVVH